MPTITICGQCACRGRQGAHVYEPESEDWNIDHVNQVLQGMPVVVVELAVRSQGLILPPAIRNQLTGYLIWRVKNLFRDRNKQAHMYC